MTRFWINIKNHKDFLAIIILVSLLLVAVFSSIKFYSFIREQSLQESVANNQAVLVRIADDKVLVGKLFVSTKEKELEKSSIVIEQEVVMVPRIAIIVTGLGLDDNLTEQAFKLPKEFTLSFAVQAQHLNEWLGQATVLGFDSVINVPMQPYSYNVFKAQQIFSNADLIIDSELDKTKILNNLVKLEQQARENGYAVGIMHPFPLTITAVNQWLGNLDKSSMHLMPLSHLLLNETFEDNNVKK